MRCLGVALAKVRGAGDEMLGVCTGEGEGGGGLVWGWIGVYCESFPVENSYFRVLWQDFILGC
jgi:hypothetical protein